MNSHNAITQRLEILNACYQEFHDNPKARLCHWLLREDEVPMLDEFYNAECSVYGKTPDFFLRFDAPFVKTASYGEILLDELAGKVQGYREELGEEGEPLRWNLQAYPHLDQQQLFLQNLSDFARSLDDFDDLVVAYLTPQDIRSFSDFEAWLLQALRLPLPENLRFMLADSAKSPAFPHLPQEMPGEVMSFEPKLEMPQAMKEVASAAAGAGNPGVQFQHHFIDLSQAIGAADMAKAQKHASQAMEIAFSNGWAHLQVAVCLALGAGWMAAKDFEKAVRECDEGKRLADAAASMKDPVAPTLVVNALFFKGSALTAAKDHGAAAETYQQAAAAAQTAKDAFKEMEAWRMAGFSREQVSEWEGAWDSYQRALSAAENVEAQVRENSTLPYVGEAMLKINDRHFGQAHRQQEVEEKMTAWLGAGWKEKFAKTKA